MTENTKNKWKIFMKVLQNISTYALPMVILYLFVVPPGYSFSKSVYKADKEVLCPGESIEFDTETHTIANTVARRHRTIVNADTGSTVVWDKYSNADIFIWTKTAKLKRHISYPVPELAPGRYELRVSLESRSARPVIYSVNFTVPPLCKK